ncbi:NAD(P)H-dependent flavin oxidoreductase [Sphingobacterium sp. MYb382]|uniref:NAD(P)H-dependent flavin oxidoreductase n=1 Tax=Sphingobacterium sp. MYb382 TaxID=2745278 RepID=UPI0030B61AFF
MWNTTAATKILGIDYPILQGPFGGGLSTVELTTAVSKWGGLGGFGAYTLTPAEIYQVHQQICSNTDKPYNLNLWVSDTDSIGTVDDALFEGVKEAYRPYFEQLGLEMPPKPSFKSHFENQLQAVLDIKPKVFSFMFGLLSEAIVEECHRKGMVLIGTATSVDEAVALEHVGVDLIVASGFEAGGHRPSFLEKAEHSLVGTFALVQLIREKVKIPVIAAGGIVNGRSMASALILGADAVQIGTAFLACDESGATRVHRDFLFSASAKYTDLTRSYTGRLGRGGRTTISQYGIRNPDNTLPFPLQSAFMADLRKAALAQRREDLVFFWSGQIAPLLKFREAKLLMNSLIEETQAILQGA